MRKEFAAAVAKRGADDERIIFLTGDLGFMALEEVRDALTDRFINMGVAEQNMISVAAGLAAQGLIPICYSIAPFTVFRPGEQIRLDVCLHNLNVKIVGNGGGYGYGIMGATHHAIEDLAFLSSLQNMRCFVPLSNQNTGTVVDAMLDHTGPSYLRLGFGSAPPSVTASPHAAVRRIREGSAVTIVGIGPVLLNALAADDEQTADIFAVSELPLKGLSPDLIASLQKTGSLVVIEEHVARGGLGENLARLLMQDGLHPKFFHAFAHGYENGLYGSQAYHQSMNGLDAASISELIKNAQS